MRNLYTIGIDYGTESGRVVLVQTGTGKEVAVHTTKYPHGVISEKLPKTNIPLGVDWCLQHPDDYLEVLRKSVKAVLAESGVAKEDIIGVGIDFTASTILPIDTAGNPLCLRKEFYHKPHSWVKLWKHHAANKEAQKLNEVAAANGEDFIERYGGKVSSEWMIPKIWQILNEAPEIFMETDAFIEAGDWIVYKLTGTLTRNSCSAGYKSLWSKQDGYPNDAFFKSLDIRLEQLCNTKLRGNVAPLGSKAGVLTKEMAEMMGLQEGTSVAVGIIDAHASVVGAGVVKADSMVIVMGTSSCHMVISEEYQKLKGISGVVEDGIIPGYYGYEAGQAAVGDIFAWFVNQCVSDTVKVSAKLEGQTTHDWLERKASQYRPGEIGLLALDWWNGNRSILGDTDLSGIIVGLTLLTKPEEIYRSLLEATAFGTRKIFDEFQKNGIYINRIYVCGGLPHRNELLMQIYADVLGMDIVVANSTQTSGLGAAIYAAVAAGSELGGYDTIQDAVKHMTYPQTKTYSPIAEHIPIYQMLYREYSKLHDYFGTEQNNVMKVLKESVRISEVAPLLDENLTD